MDAYRAEKCKAMAGGSERPGDRFVARQMRPTARSVLGGLLAASLLALWSGSAEALVVSTTLDTTGNPADYGPDWTQGDPGWENVTSTGSNYVYLRDGWVLSARHVGVWSATFTVGSETTSFSPIPNQNFVVPNPAELGFSAQTDLRLIRINGDPGLPDVTIASAPPSANSQVVMITNGPTRAANPTYWNVVGSTWSEVVPPDAYNRSGFKMGAPRTRRWGTNQIATANSVFPSEDVLSSVTGKVTLEGGDGVSRDVVSLATVFDQSGTSFEAQAGKTASGVAGGDSGGALFYKRGGQWELTGIIDAISIYDGQSASWAVYGDATTFADLSTYRDEIQAIMDDHPNYSVMGDINLSGTVTGDGAGDPATDDVAAFVAGWMYDNGTGQGDITSWKNGDITGPLGQPDGKTDVSDFLMMRSVLSLSGSGSLAALLGMGVAGVPEPSSAALVLIGGAALAAFGLRRRRPAAVLARP